MSSPLLREDVLYFQRFLSCCGLYSGKLDGKWGPITNAADQAFDQQCETIAGQVTIFDRRSERNIRSLLTPVQKLAREALRAIRAAGLDARIISGTRTYAEQNAIYRQGRFGNPGPVVSNARGGQSWHNFGRAWDIGIFRADGGYITSGPEYDQAAGAVVGHVPGVEWGGNWKKFKDRPHYQVTGGLESLTAVRTQFENGGR